jgi:signal transduction histidine kinase
VRKSSRSAASAINSWKKRMLNKIRFRLTITNSIVLILVLIFICAFVYVAVDLNVIAYTNGELVENTYQLKRYMTLAETPSTQKTNPELYEEYLTYEQKMLSNAGYFSIWDYNGNAILQQGSFYVPEDILAAIRALIFTYDTKADKIIRENDGSYYIHVYAYQSTNIRICTTVCVNDNGEMRLIQTASNMNEKNAVTTRLLKALVLAGLVGVTLSFAGGYMLSGRSMIPIIQSIKSQNEFIADASHELRTPLTIIRTNLDVVMSSTDEPVASQAAWLDNAYGETKRMEKMIGDLLLLAKSDLNQVAFDFTRIDIARLCEETIRRFAPLAGQKNIAIALDTAACTDPWVDADKERISQLIGIVLDNALTYSPNGTKIEVRLENIPNALRLQVKDEGIGVEKSDLENIFKRFYRTDKARNRREGGTGLGLAIAKWIAQAHSGKIWAESEINRGTAIIAELPQKKEIKNELT